MSFAGESVILTTESYKRLDELNNKYSNIININNDTFRCFISCSGLSKLIKLEFDNGSNIICSPDQLIMNEFGEPNPAKSIQIGTSLKSFSGQKIVVSNIENIGKNKAYAFTQISTMWIVVNDIVVHY